MRPGSSIRSIAAIVASVIAMGADGKALLEHSTSYYIGLSLAWSAAIFVVFGLLAVLRFARR
jgi:hypothetical protein